MTHLKFHEIDTVDEFVWPEKVTGVTIKSPAMLFFTDFEKIKPLVIDLATRADLARSLMIREHVKLKLVVNSDDKFMGVVSLDDISEQRITAKLSKTIKRDSITVADLMVPKREIKGLDFSEVEHVDIGTVVHHLKDIGQQHCLVLDKKLNKIRGIFSASDISRKLGLAINVQDHSNFYRVFSALAS